MVEGSSKIIIEGDGILPTLAHQNAFNEIPSFESIDVRQKVRAVFLIEHDESVILDNLQKRGRGFNVANKERQEAFANASKLFGQQLAQEAQNNQVPVLEARPKETIFARTLETIR